MIILGIDPGYGRLGYGIIDAQGPQSLKVVDFGIIETAKEESIQNRLLKIKRAIEQLIEKYKPDEIALEELFYFKNQKTIINVAQARGVALVACCSKVGDESLFEYTPLQIKMALTGYGRADKKQIQEMVKMFLKLKTIPRPDDAADALAVAICHAQTARFTKLFKINR